MARLQLWKIPLVFFCGALVTGLASAQLTIYANTPSPSTDGTANTVMGVVGSTVVSTLLDSGSNALLWGYVPSSAVIAACQQIVDTGSYQLTATVHDNWGGGPNDIIFEVKYTGGCLSASDGSGTEISGTDQSGRMSAIVCLNNAAEDGCPVWITGEDVDAASNSFTLQNADSRNNRRRLLINDCSTGAIIGGGFGLTVGVVAVLASCLAPLAIVAPEICAALLVEVAIGGAVAGGFPGCGIAVGVESACFPGDALVLSQNGNFLPMMHLKVGQKVAVWKTSESKLSSSMVIYDEIYAFGHKDESSKRSFYKITMIPLELDHTELGTEIGVNYSTRTLEISGLHFLPTMKVIDSNTGKKGHQVLHKRAKDIKVGEYVWALEDGGLARPHIVTAVSVTFKQGLYNPLTLSGTIVVNMVVASVHSDWFLDSTFDMLGISSSLPYAYQIVLAPLRLVYKIWPKRLYVFLYDWLDARLDVAELGTKFYGPTVVTVGFITSVLPAASYLCNKFRVLHGKNGSQ